MAQRRTDPEPTWPQGGAVGARAGSLPFRPTPHAVLREQLLARIEGANEARIIVVTGVAGSGKSTLVWQWVDRLAPERPVAWLTLNPRDNSPTRLWPHLHAALKAAAPDLSWQPSPLVDDDSIEALLMELNTQYPALAIVLDDLQFLIDEPILTAVGSLVAGLGPTSRLALVSRTRPSPRLARALTAGDVGQIRGSELFFTVDETRSALLAVGDRGGPEVASSLAEVQDFTGGWPVAVGLAARLPWAAHDQVRRGLRAARLDLADYRAFARRPSPRPFTMATSDHRVPRFAATNR
jgi:LuxR family maltose regulon positive regulatory protein